MHYNTQFITSAAGKSGFITPDKPMIAICGRSNVGKSTFINMLANRNKLAKTSSTPGRTRLVNYFDFGEFMLADLPGYGFAKVSKTEKQKWGIMLEDFFAQKENITHVFALVDIRHQPSEEDIEMINFLYAHIIAFTIVATKSDKIGKTYIKPRIREIAAALKIGEGDIIAISSTDKKNKHLVTDKITQILNAKAAL